MASPSATEPAPRRPPRAGGCSTPSTDPSVLGGGTSPVERHETHGSWVFVAGDRALKVKKPRRAALPGLRDARSAAARCAARRSASTAAWPPTCTSARSAWCAARTAAPRWTPTTRTSTSSSRPSSCGASTSATRSPRGSPRRRATPGQLRARRRPPGAPSTPARRSRPRRPSPRSAALRAAIRATLDDLEAAGAAARDGRPSSRVLRGTLEALLRVPARGAARARARAGWSPTATATCAPSTCCSPTRCRSSTPSSSTPGCGSPTSPATSASSSWTSRAAGAPTWPRRSSPATATAGGDPGDDALLAAMACYRALVRAKVDVVRAGQGDPGAPRAAAARLDQAVRFAWRARGPQLLAVCGRARDRQDHAGPRAVRAERHGAHLLRPRPQGARRRRPGRPRPGDGLHARGDPRRLPGARRACGGGDGHRPRRGHRRHARRPRRARRAARRARAGGVARCATWSAASGGSRLADAPRAREHGPERESDATAATRGASGGRLVGARRDARRSATSWSAPTARWRRWLRTSRPGWTGLRPPFPRVLFQARDGRTRLRRRRTPRPPEKTWTPPPAACLSIARGVLSDLDLETVLERVLDSARELTGASYAALGVLDEQRDAPGAVRDGRHRREDAAGDRAAAHRPRRARRADHPPGARCGWPTSAPTRSSYGFPAGHPPMTTFLGVPDRRRRRRLRQPLPHRQGRRRPSSPQDDEDAARAAGRVRRGRHRPRAPVHRLRAPARGVAAHRRHAGRHGADRAGARGPDRPADDPRAGHQARPRAGVGPRAGDRAAGRSRPRGRRRARASCPTGLIGHRVELAGTVAERGAAHPPAPAPGGRADRARFEQHGLGHLGVHAGGGLVVPLIFQSRAYGVLVAVDRLEDGPEFSLDDERLLQAFATSAATAVATAQSVQAEGQAPARRGGRGRAAPVGARAARRDAAGPGGAAPRARLCAPDQRPAAVDAAIAGAVEQLDERDLVAARADHRAAARGARRARDRRRDRGACGSRRAHRARRRRSRSTSRSTPAGSPTGTCPRSRRRSIGSCRRR